MSQGILSIFSIETAIKTVTLKAEQETKKIIASLNKDIANYEKILASKKQDLTDANNTLAKITNIKTVIAPNTVVGSYLTWFLHYCNLFLFEKLPLIIKGIIIVVNNFISICINKTYNTFFKPYLKRKR